MVYIPSSIDLVWLPYNPTAKVSKLWSTISISRTIGLKYVFVRIISCPAFPISGTALGLLVGALLGVNVKNTNVDWESVYAYLGDTLLTLLSVLATLVQ